MFAMSHEATVFVYMLLAVTGIIISGKLIEHIRRIDGAPMAVGAGIVWAAVIVIFAMFFSN